jgi:hypothetical protein
LLSVFPAHAPADSAIARELSLFVEAGCDALCPTLDAAIRPGEDLLSAAEIGLSADVAILLISPASTLPRWPLERWQSILFAGAEEAGTRVAVVLLEPCAFPDLFRRKLKFFDASVDRLAAFRKLKRWLWGLQHGVVPASAFSKDLDFLYGTLADGTGSITTSGALAERFAIEAVHDFDRILWVPAQGRTLAQVAGELGHQLDIALNGETEDNCRRIRETLTTRRCLLILDAPEVPVESLLPSGRTSVLVTSEPVRIMETPRTLAHARKLVASRRFAEAYEILSYLLEKKIDAESCARELVWICDQWGRYAEASALRGSFRMPPSEQLSLF